MDLHLSIANGFVSSKLYDKTSTLKYKISPLTNVFILFFFYLFFLFFFAETFCVEDDRKVIFMSKSLS